MSSPSVPAALPTPLVTACVLTLVLSSFVGLSAAGSLTDAVFLEQLRAAPPLQWFPDASANAHVQAALVGALEQLRVPRALTAGALCLFCGLGLVGAMRMLRPREMPRESLRRLLSGALLWCAVLRTIEGAEDAVLYRRYALALAEGFIQADRAAAEVADAFRSIMGLVGVLTACALTAVMVGGFVLLRQYFRSARVQKLLGGE